ncbi:hypothetical protein QUB49_35465 [Microcoleus sp. AT9_B4]
MTATAGSVASNLPRINVYIERELKEAAENLAKKQRRSLSALVCILLEEAIQKEVEKTFAETETQKSEVVVEAKAPNRVTQVK